MTTAGASPDALTPVEWTLVEYVERGELLDLAGDLPTDEAAMHSWDESRTIRAGVIRDIMRGRLARDPDPHGLRLRGARIIGRVDLANLTSTVCLDLDDCLLDEGLSARDAHLARVRLSGCRLQHPHEPAMDAARLTAPVVIASEATITGHSARGALTLIAAHLGGLDCTATTLRNDSGPALHAERIRVDQHVFLRSGFDATGAGALGAVHLDSAHLGGLDCRGATLRNDSGPALHGCHIRVDQGVFLDEGFEATGGGDRVVVDLNDARIGGALGFAPARMEHHITPNARLEVDGLVYSGLPDGIPTEDWLKLLREGTPGYAAQPYQHLAAALRGAGHDSEARRVLMAQRRDQIQRRTLTRRAERAWVRLTGLTLGYGYQPWRALVGLLAVLITSVLLAVVLGTHGGLAQPRTPTPPTPLACTITDRVGVGLDLGTPLITTGAGSRCQTTNTTTGQILNLTDWTLRLLAWAFATLFVAGFTSAVRKT